MSCGRCGDRAESDARPATVLSAAYLQRCFPHQSIQGSLTARRSVPLREPLPGASWWRQRSLPAMEGFARPARQARRGGRSGHSRLKFAARMCRRRMHDTSARGAPEDPCCP